MNSDSGAMVRRAASRRACRPLSRWQRLAIRPLGQGSCAPRACQMLQVEVRLERGSVGRGFEEGRGWASGRASWAEAAS